MSLQRDKRTRTQEPAPEEHLPGGENPRNVPDRELDAAPPQPDVPERGEVEERQDQQPVRPGAVIHPPHNPTGQQKELVNG